MPKACPYVLMEICVVFKLVVDVGGGCLWCGGWGEMKQRQEAVASGAVLV